MALLNYSAFASLDGYIADEQGDFSWAMPSPEAHTLANELMEPIGTCIYGRRMYEMMTTGIRQRQSMKVRESSTTSL